MNHHKSTALERSVKKLLWGGGGLNRFYGRLCSVLKYDLIFDNSQI